MPTQIFPPPVRHFPAEPPDVETTSGPPLPTPSRASRLLAFAIAGIAWLAIAAQVTVTIERTRQRGLGLLDAMAWLSSYLTHLTVLAVAVTFTCLVPRSDARSRFLGSVRQASVVTAIVLYIVFVGLAYNILLRGIWTPTGYRRLLTETQHTILPLLCAIYWMGFVPRFHPGWRKCLWWLVYPLVYLFITLWRGSRSDFYPYFFIDVAELGYPDVLFNAAMLVLAFLALMGLFVLFNHRRRR